LRLRTTATDQLGNPKISTERKYVHPGLQHVVYTRGHTGAEKIYVNGTETYSGIREGSFASWDKEYSVELGNIKSGQASWDGTFYLVALYNRNLQPEEVQTNYDMGIGDILFQTELADLSPGSTYYLKPMALTDQGIAYGDSLSLAIEDEEFPSLEDRNQMKIYPNPSNGNFTVYFEDNSYSAGVAYLKISDLAGNIIYIEEISLADVFFSKEVHMNLSGFINSGFYSVILAIGSKSVASKLVIQN